MRSRKAWLAYPRSATIQPGMIERSVRSSGASGSSCACPGARAKPMARPEASAITQALVQNPPRERPSPSRASRSAAVPPFWPRLRPCGGLGYWCRRGTPCRPRRRHAAALPPAIAPRRPQPRPAAEGLRRHPPRAQFRRDLAPLRPVVVPPDDRLNRATQVVMLRLVWRTARLDHRCKHLPLRIRQNLRPVSIRHPDQMGTILRDSQALILELAPPARNSAEAQYPKPDA